MRMTSKHLILIAVVGVVGCGFPVPMKGNTGGGSAAVPLSCTPKTACLTKTGSISPPDGKTFAVNQCTAYNAVAALQSSVDAEIASCKLSSSASAGDEVSRVTACPTANLLGSCKVISDENQCRIVSYYSGTTNPPKSTADVQSSCESLGGTFIGP